MKTDSLTIPDVLLISLTVHEDARGYFMESYNWANFNEAGIDLPFVQDNHSASKQGVLRGLHYQIRKSQGKLVRVVTGEVYDVCVDLRRSSKSFGKSVHVPLTAEKKEVLWVPPGFAHGFYTLSEWAEVIYKTTDYYAPEYERTLHWNDPALGIEWPLIDGGPPILSTNDSQGRPLSEADTYP